mmetsp:Transcript_46100/g.107829  ORF Transcript_46100/g.107829 Transcript_46100/m.107829 type:complete len:830 (+) Transcript_46100:108-2597(+)
MARCWLQAAMYSMLLVRCVSVLANELCLNSSHKLSRAAPSLIAVRQHLQRKPSPQTPTGKSNTDGEDNKAGSNDDDLAQTLEDALQWEMQQMEKSLEGDGGPKLGAQPGKVMGVALNGRDDLRMLRSALMIGIVGVVSLAKVFCVLRKICPVVYIKEADLVLEDAADDASGASPRTAPRHYVKPQVSLLDWVATVWHTTPEDEVSQAGLDGWAFLEFRRLNWRIFSVIGPVLGATLLPMHYEAHRTTQNNLDMLSMFDIGRDPLPDWMLWVHAAMVWFVVCVSAWTIACAQEHFTERRYQWLKEIPFPRAKTVLVRNIPSRYRSDSALKQYFVNLFSEDVIERAYVVRHTGRLYQQVSALKQARLDLLHAKQHWEEVGRPAQNESETLRLARCEKREKLLAQEVSQAQERLAQGVSRGDPTVCSSTGFVTFTNELSKRLASREQYTRDVTDFHMSTAPDPHDLIYANLAEEEMNSAGWNWAGIAAIWGVFTLWVPFVVLISSWTTFGALQDMLPTLKEMVQRHMWLDKLLTGVFATIALKVFLAFLPTAMYIIIRTVMSVKSHTEVQIKMQKWYGLFLVTFVLLVTTLSRGVTLTMVSIAQKPGRIFRILADFLPSASHFYFNYTVLGWIVPFTELVRNANFWKFHTFKLFFSMSEKEAKEYSEPEDPASYGFGARMASSLLISAITFAFCSCSPLILVFSFISLSLSQASYTYLVVHAESKKPDTGGVLWIHSINHLFMVITMYILLMTGVLQMLSSSGKWAGPPLVALASSVALYAAKHRVDSLAFDVLPLEEVVRTTQELSKKAKHEQGQYLQPECDQDVVRVSMS